MDFLADALTEDAKLSNQDFSKHLIQFKEARNCTFTKCSFAESTLRECSFISCTFVRCDFSLGHVNGSRFRGVRFDGCKLLGLDWAEATWEKVGLLQSVEFHGCALNYGSFFGLRLPRLRLTDCTAHEVDFADADLTGAVFDGTDFSGSRFQHTNLANADFSRASHYSIDATANTLKKTRFALPEALSLLHSLDIILTDPDT